MNSKGFTLIELLGVIAVLAIVSIIGLVGYNVVNDNLKETSYENLILLIETKAKDYAMDNNIELSAVITVDDLVKEGYLETEANGTVINPVTNKKINCNEIIITKINGDYIIEIDIKRSEEITKVC